MTISVVRRLFAGVFLLFVANACFAGDSFIEESFWNATQFIGKVVPLSALAAAAVQEDPENLEKRNRFLRKDVFKTPDTEALFTHQDVELHLNRRGLQLIRNF